jgi:uncharacterized protein YycO
MPKFGDVIFFESDGTWWDNFIKLVSPRYTHIGLFIDDNRFIEAQNPHGVVITEYQDSKYKNEKILSIKNTHRVSNIDYFIYKHLGESYSVPNAIQVGLYRIFGWHTLADQVDRNWICSEFVGYLLRNAFKLDLGTAIATPYLLPDDILKAPIYRD